MMTGFPTVVGPVFRTLMPSAQNFWLRSVAGPLAVIVLITLPCCSTAPDGQEIGVRARETGGVDRDLREALKRAGEERVRAFIQFQRALTLDEHERLHEIGVRYLTYVPPHGYVASLPGVLSLEYLSGRPSLVQSATLLSIDNKLSPNLVQPAKSAEEQVLEVTVVFFADVSPEAAEAALLALGLSAGPRGALNSWRVEVHPSQLSKLGSHKDIMRIEKRAKKRELLITNDLALQETGADDVQKLVGVPPSASFDGRAGKGIRIGICDEPIDETHMDFQDLAGQSRFYRSWTPGYIGFHATKVASIAAGIGLRTTAQFPSQVPLALRGHAPLAGLGNYPSFYEMVDKYVAAIVHDSTQITVHPYELSESTEYNSDSAAVDNIITGKKIWFVMNWPGRETIPARPQVWSAGDFVFNNYPGFHVGYYSITCPAKNAICVGAVETNSERVSNVSYPTSLGPTIDGRLKPDLVAPGSHTAYQGIVAAIPTNGQNVYYGAGTTGGSSFAAPMVAGILALMMEEVTTLGIDPDDILPSTYKAVLIQTADDIEGPGPNPPANPKVNPDTNNPVTYPKGPDYATGFGLVDAIEATNAIGNSMRWAESSLRQGGETQWCIFVPHGTTELKVALVWDDLPATSIFLSGAVKRLVNDLDLVLIAPDHEAFHPCVQSLPPQNQNPSLPNDPATNYLPEMECGVDRRNNAELVAVENPLPGIWTLRVSAFVCPFGTTQKFSVASSRPLIPILCYDPNRRIARQRQFCEDFPEFCRQPFVPPDFFPDLNRWNWPSGAVLDVEELALVAGVDLSCDGLGWQAFGGFTIRANGLPNDAHLILFDDLGRVLSQNPSQDSSQGMRLDQIEPGRHYMVLMADSDGKPLREEVDLELLLERH